jgi:hypothetical protein
MLRSLSRRRQFDPSMESYYSRANFVFHAELREWQRQERTGTSYHYFRDGQILFSPTRYRRPEPDMHNWFFPKYEAVDIVIGYGAPEWAIKKVELEPLCSVISVTDDSSILFWTYFKSLALGDSLERFRSLYCFQRDVFRFVDKNLISNIYINFMKNEKMISHRFIQSAVESLKPETGMIHIVTDDEEKMKHSVQIIKENNVRNRATRLDSISPDAVVDYMVTPMVPGVYDAVGIPVKAQNLVNDRNPNNLFFTSWRRTTPIIPNWRFNPRNSRTILR